MESTNLGRIMQSGSQLHSGPENPPLKKHRVTAPSSSATISMVTPPKPLTNMSYTRTSPVFQSTFIVTDPKNSAHCSVFNARGSLCAFGANEYIKVLDCATAHVFYRKHLQQKYSIETTPVTHTGYGHVNQVTDISFHPILCESIIASSDSSGSINFYDLRSVSDALPVSHAHSVRTQFWGTALSPFSTLKDTHSIHSFEFHPSGKLVAVATESPLIRLYTLSDFSCYLSKNQQTSHLADINDIRFTPAGDKYISVSEDGSLCFWDATTSTLEHRKAKAHNGFSLWSVSVPRSGNYALTYGADMTARLWDLRTTKCVYSYSTEPKSTLMGVKGKAVVHFDENQVFLTNGTFIEAFDLRKTILSFDIAAHSYPITSLASSPATAALCSTASDSQFRYWQDRGLSL